MSIDDQAETLTHRLILPQDANHYGTLYAGRLMSLALEAAYAAAYRAAGKSASLVLKRVLDLRCFEPVGIGEVVEIRGREVHRARAFLVVGLIGSPRVDRKKPWMDALFQFVQIDADGVPEPLAVEPPEVPPVLQEPWGRARNRARKLLAIRS